MSYVITGAPQWKTWCFFWSS